MLRQLSLNINRNIPIRGAPPKIKARMPHDKIIHQSQKPAYPFNIDFNQLNLKYPIVYQPTYISKYGWSAKPETSPEYPFFIERTTHTGSVPVYTDFIRSNTKVVTILRRCGGDVETLRDEMSKVCDGKQVRILRGRLEVDGNYSQRLKRWIIGLGL